MPATVPGKPTPIPTPSAILLLSAPPPEEGINEEGGLDPVVEV